jgi:hypothetical protein
VLPHSGGTVPPLTAAYTAARPTFTGRGDSRPRTDARRPGRACDDSAR